MADATREPARLSTPGRRRRSALPRLKWGRDTFGQFAEGFARFMGTARFLGYMTVFVVVWIGLNIVGLYGYKWDPYPFILLNLFFSTQASYAAPLILLAQNRQEARDRVTLEADRTQTAQSRADTDFLAREIAGLRMSVGELATRDFLRGQLRNELRAIVEELDAENEAEAAGDDRLSTPKPPERRSPPNGWIRPESLDRDPGLRGSGSSSR